MKTLKFFGAMLVLSAFLMPTFAYHSTITDKAAGRAIDIVETNNIIHVYTYTGASSEAEMSSTFNQGENWLNVVTTPKASTTTKVNYQKSTPSTLYSRTNRSSAVTQESIYVKMVDECVDLGMRWNFRDDTCIEQY